MGAKKRAAVKGERSGAESTAAAPPAQRTATERRAEALKAIRLAGIDLVASCEGERHDSVHNVVGRLLQAVAATLQKDDIAGAALRLVRGAAEALFAANDPRTGSALWAVHSALKQSRDDLISKGTGQGRRDSPVTWAKRVLDELGPSIALDRAALKESLLRFAAGEVEKHGPSETALRNIVLHSTMHGFTSAGTWEQRDRELLSTTARG